MTVLLEAFNVSVRYASFVALDQVSFAVHIDEFVSIVGPNGAGKTTLVNVLTGLSKPSSGVIRLRGDSINGCDPVNLTCRGLARSFQLVSIFPDLTVRETLVVGVTSRQPGFRQLFRSVHRSDVVMAQVEKVASLFNLVGRLNTRAGTLSQGEKKLLDVASAFACRPEVVLLDEPTSGVSTADKREILNVVVGAAKAAGVRSIVQVEHDMDLVANYSDRIVALQGGRVIGDLPPREFFKNQELVDVVVGRHRRIG